jgi:hypothetical protein
MSETPIEELVRYTVRLAMSVKPECSGNGSYNREYMIGKITLAIDGWWGAGKDDWNKEYDTGYSVEYGEVELLDGATGEPPTEQTSDDALILKVLEEVRNHMVLERLADV